jgi:hypothetical protein
MSKSTDSSNTIANAKLQENNVEKGKEEKKSIDNVAQVIKLKEDKFNELVNWLGKWGYKVMDKTKENNVKDIEFRAEVTPLLPYSTGITTPFFVEFQNGLDDAFIIRTYYELEKNIEAHLKNQNRAREIELTYIEIEQIVLPMKISIVRAHPIINTYKVIFLEGLTKQFFHDSINDLVNANSLIIGKWDEKYYSMVSKNTKEEGQQRQEQGQQQQGQQQKKRVSAEIEIK